VRTIRLLLEYDGAGYSGWQAQANGASVQETLETAVRRVTGEAVRLAASGRTDAGVHALGQVAAFETAHDLRAERFAAALNAHLPADIAVLSSGAAPAGFHPRRSARSKTYRYRILNRPARSALLCGRAYHLVPPLDLDAMREAGRHLVGRHDFRAFTPAASKRSGYRREIFSLQVSRSGDEVVVEVCGSGFLQYMVRILAGTLIEVGRGRLPAGEIPGILASRDRERAGPTALACGLYLVSVDYGESGPFA